MPGTRQIKKRLLSSLPLLILQMSYIWVNWHQVSHIGRQQNVSLLSCVVPFLLSSWLGHSNYLNLCTLPGKSWQGHWVSNAIRFVKLSRKLKCFILKWLPSSSSFFFFICYSLTFLISLFVWLVWFSAPFCSRDVVFLIPSLGLVSSSLPSAHRQDLNRCPRGGVAFPPLADSGWPPWAFSLLHGLMALENLSLQPVPGHLLPSLPEIQGDSNSPCPECPLRFLL